MDTRNTQHATRLGIYSFLGYRMPLPEAFRLIRAAGFGATTLWWDDDGVEGAGANREDLPRLAREEGLLVENVHVPFEESNDWWSDDAGARERIVANHRRWLDDCARHGIPCLVTHLSKKTGPAEAGRHGVESMARVVSHAEEVGVRVAVENTRRRDCLDLILTEIPSPALGFCCDTSHAWLWSDDPLGLIRRWLPRMITTHLSDNDGREDRHWLPGRGIVDWAGVAGALRDGGYRGPLTLEVFAGDEAPLPPPEGFLHRAFAWLSGLAAQTAAP